MALPPAPAAALSALSSLAELRCCVGVPPPTLLPAVLRLACLTCLEIESVVPPPGDVSQLTTLTALRVGACGWLRDACRAAVCLDICCPLLSHAW